MVRLDPHRMKDELAEQAHHLQQVMNQLEEWELTLSAMKEEIIQLDQALQREIQQKQTKDEEITSLRQQLQESNQMVAELQRHLNELKPPPPPVRKKYSSNSLQQEAYLDYREVEENRNKSRDVSMILQWECSSSTMQME